MGTFRKRNGFQVLRENYCRIFQGVKSNMATGLHLVNLPMELSKLELWIITFLWRIILFHFFWQALWSYGQTMGVGWGGGAGGGGGWVGLHTYPTISFSTLRSWLYNRVWPINPRWLLTANPEVETKQATCLLGFSFPDNLPTTIPIMRLFWS